MLPMCGADGHYRVHMRSEQALLSELARKVRERRQAVGLTVSELARRSGLSRRYVTEAEAGRANPTILKLAQLAAALRMPLAELCDLRVGALRGERIALVGLRGAGKSAIGRRLALALEVPFVELDQRVEVLAGMSLAEIFDLRGAPTYRRLEREALEAVLAEGGRLVIATGGSIVTSKEAFTRLRESCRTLWLRATPEDHLERVYAQGDRRPMQGRPRAMDELRAILAERTPLYETCEFALDTSTRDVDEVVGAALEWLA
ncbi:MAG: helix-turn-helix domain-containing protein [Planctomycetota bacterium]|nr:MAG: helix-turn-helix domain-containing protein [Planctomycetota bacterium]